MIPAWAFIIVSVLIILNNVIILLLVGPVRRLREEVLTTLQELAARHEGSISQQLHGDDHGPD